MERNKNDDQDKEFKVDISQVTKNLFPFDTPEEKIEENKGKEEDYA